MPPSVKYTQNLNLAVITIILFSGAKKLGTDEAEFNRILCCYSYPVLRTTFDEYRKITGKTFESAIHSETSGDFKDGLMALCKL